MITKYSNLHDGDMPSIELGLVGDSNNILNSKVTLFILQMSNLISFFDFMHY